ncbi:MULTISPECIES: IMP cyclohydrolase [Methanosphaera]|jgi:IMP cyclohydrolase|uniref:IMP cyclohydrolase n=2 Tax=Methanosphaera stadtmanae TaxID=2317 RepID=PURO_METST|nr:MULTISPECIES: IMP cyclohydrolase [Methanosphaera]Q2NEI3.1 RecName: Full=IMP cyclohydrolase; AltName: Full=IMP synthase; AltName: Full=Inosinicase [Methanosphaera stadtmanae DSM 3091]ABC57770.1 PurO [Methanosphaera stadtmanae DSM 3091]MEE0490199.1 IMP cyclohydrolase [Methanosphaera stadtmanae]OEC93442.1 IMP cyclohydrolase [Methanosphaera sp. A6]RAP02543.1 IMP cyclohydrolase [Methanosphaera stadtmanae]RAP46370.1 MAG: IMP cyclohydrolase [Methanosphaera sp. DEW79]
MYLGRIISIGSSKDGVYASYRVSSRSFPNRKSVVNNQKVAIIPTQGSEDDIYKNPYISYNCIDIIDDICVVTNGSHTDIIAGKIREGMNMKDAVALSLLTMDYEKDDYNTPRIGGAINTKGEGYIGIVTHEGIEVKKVNPGESFYVSTYEHNTPREVDYTATNAKEATEFIFNGGIFSEFTHPVTSCAAFNKDEWEIDFKNP